MGWSRARRSAPISWRGSSPCLSPRRSASSVWGSCCLGVLLDDVFGVEISEGAIATLLARTQAPLVAAAEAIGAQVRSSPVIGSHETAARVAGKTWGQG